MPMLVTLAKANTVTLDQGAYSYDVGGEFTAYTSPQSFLGNYASSATLNGGFETFCIETAVDFYPGSTYTYNLSAVDSQGRQLSEGAAFLYYEFANGQLSGYDYNTANTYADVLQRRTDAGLLQSALWWLQGQQSYNDGNYQIPTTSNNPYYNLAITTLGAANATNANNGTYGVDVLQMWNGSTAAQNQLVCVSSGSGGGNGSPVPDNGSTAGLIAMALAGMISLKFFYDRQFARTKLK